MSIIDGIVTGDGAEIPFQLTRGTAKTVFAIPETATVKAVIVSSDRANRLTEVVTCLPSFAGADWANSLIVVKLTSLQTAEITGLTAGQGELEAVIQVQVDDVIKESWFDSVTVIKGLI